MINPVGNFPLNDDWWYAYLFEELFVKGHNTNLSWVSTSLFGQLLITKPYALVFGYSYAALRFFTLMLSFFTIYFIHSICKQHFKLSDGISFFICLLVMFNPLFLCLSNSYMTDVPFMFMLVGALYFYLCYKTTFRFFYLLLSILFFSTAILTRQITLAFLPGLLLVEFLHLKKFDFKLLFLFTVPVLVLFVFEYWLQNSSTNNGYNFVFSEGIKSRPGEALMTFSKRWVHYLSISGFLLFPVLIPYVIKQLGSKIFRTLSFWLALLVCIPVIVSIKNFPIGNYLYNAGIGPDTFYDVYILNINHAQNEWNILLYLMQAMAALGAFSITLLLISSFKILIGNLKKKEVTLQNSFATYLLLSLFFYYLFLCFTTGIFDRYIMVFAIFALLVFAQTHNNFFPNTALTKLLLLLFVLFSLAGTKDYLQLNRTKWEAVSFLKTNFHISDSDINAGYEHAGSSRPETPEWFDKWRNIKPSPYLLSKGPVKGYSKFNFFSYQRYLPYKEDTVFILRLNPDFLN
ncbi:MAG: hypothetical protein IT236_06355 [Bacteroidia bacterium]|nr:hypothetical protein [Bacteroidia bacterium]